MPSLSRAIKPFSRSPARSARDVEIVQGENARRGFGAGFLGAGVLAGIIYIAWGAGKGPKPLFLEVQHHQFGHHGPLDHVAGLARFGLVGGFWGALYGLLPGRSSIAKGAVFGILPSLFHWTVLTKAHGEELFYGFRPDKILFPLFFSSGIWGTFVGWTMSRAEEH